MKSRKMWAILVSLGFVLTGLVGCQSENNKEDKKADAKKEEQSKVGKQTQTTEKTTKPSAEEKAKIEQKKAEAEDVKEEAKEKALTTLRDLEENMEMWKQVGHGTLSKDDRFAIQSNIQGYSTVSKSL